MIKYIGLSILVFLSSLSVFASDIPMNTAVLRGLDKVTGRIRTFSVPVGEIARFGKTFVSVEKCLKKPPEESPEDSVFMHVFEKTLQGENVTLFSGWMFSSNPALSCMEHPVYDIWIIECRDEEEKPNLPDNTFQLEQKNDELDFVKN